MWRFVQSFGDDNSSDDDLITAVAFDYTGKHIAVGDKAGRICLFSSVRNNGEDEQGVNSLYEFHAEFQSHEPEFDCLKSTEIQERINAIKWLPPRGKGVFLLATNDKTIRLWKVHDKKIMRPARSKNGQFLTRGNNSNSSINSQLKIPKLVHYQTLTTPTSKNVFSNAHVYHINSVSLNTDGEMFLSADDLRINLWHLETNAKSFNVVDLKPDNPEDLTEVITAAQFRPTDCNTLIYGSSRGSIRWVDLRDNALANHCAKQFEVPENPARKSFFSEIIASVGDCKFTPDGRYIVSRDYLSMKIWDVKMENRPVKVIPVHEYLRGFMVNLYEKDCVFDKFECAVSPDGHSYLSGSYNSHFVVHNSHTDETTTVRAMTQTYGPDGKLNDCVVETPNVKVMDFAQKTTHTAWHPTADILAVCCCNKLYVYDYATVLPKAMNPL